MKKETYNGWTNYETWVVNLWIGNDKESYDYWHQIADNCLAMAEKTDIFTKEEGAKYKLADCIKNDLEEKNPLSDSPSFYSDLLGGAISEVNFSEIAGHLILEHQDIVANENS